MIKVNSNTFGPWAIVTGASSGIGKEFARQLAASKLNLVLVARRLPLLEALGLELASQYGIQYRTVGADLSNPGFIKQIEQATEGLDIGLVISNAGSGNPGEFLAIEMEELQKVVNLNVIANLQMVHHFGQKLAKRGRGGIVMVSAMGAQHGLPYMSNDAATKAYLVSLGEGLNVEFAPKGVHITVVLPGPTETPVLEKFGLDINSMPVKPMSVEQCVDEGLAALNNNKATHLTGWMNRLMTSLIPASLTRKMLGAMLKTGAEKRATHVAV